MMRIESVGKRYGLRQPWVVRDVSLEVAAGQLIRLEGPNGSGKSTLLRVLAGVTAPSAGRVTGRPHTGYVPERFPAGLAFSAREYLLHMGRLHGLRGSAVAAAADEWLNRLGATDYAAAPLRTLSKGMCQKVAIAQALMSRPGLLVLDEAWTGLDQAARGALDAAACERLAEGGSVMFVDHQQGRLTAQLTQRWQFERGGVTVRAVGPERAADGVAGSAGDPAATVLIELSGRWPDAAAELAAVPGVRSVTRDEAAGSVRVATTAAECDAVLRQLLGRDDVHVVSVQPARSESAQ
jgi:ABC-2 type transport system ATP-binding protein